MALKKEIILDNGIVLNYHRVASVNNITNQTSIIEVASYINEAQRQKEIDWYKATVKGDMKVFINAQFIETDYDKNLNVDNAYDYLKTLEQFKDAEDC